MDILTLLDADHEKALRIIDEITATSDRATATRDELFIRLKKELTLHERVEEEVFYKALREFPESRKLVIEGFEAHDLADQLLQELGTIPYDDERWGAKFALVRENVLSHVERERTEIFSAAKRHLSKAELETLGERAQLLREEAIREFSLA